MKLDIVYEDNHIIVVVKPKKVPSQADKTKDEDMLTIIKEYIKEKYNKPGNVYLGLVHRLDRMTEGLMVFAKTSKAASRLSESIRIGDFKKEYLAVVYGKMNMGETKTLTNFLYKDERNNLSKVVDENKKGAKEAKLEYTVIGHTTYKGEECSYVRIKLYTGRHHQIRVQMSHIGFPLVGDVKYGKQIKEDLALRAYKLSFIHPTKDEIMEFKSMPNKKKLWKDLEATSC